jgi:long-subunit fatty acid transport protein
LKLGVIYRPFEESPFRVGLAVHTPTWYDLTESYNATLSSDIVYWGESYTQTLSDELNPDYLIYDYHLVTPWKFNVSMGTTLSNLVALGAEYEYQDYSSAQMQDMDGYELGGQNDINDFLKGVHTFRVGMEALIAPQFSLRAGYNYSTAAFQDYAYNSLSLYGTNTDFNNTQSKNTFTAGFGYRGSVIYADMAYKYDMYKSDFCAFDSNYNFVTGETDLLPAASVNNNRHQLVLTIGARF